MIKRLVKFFCYKIYTIAKFEDMKRTGAERNVHLAKIAIIHPSTIIQDGATIHNFQNDRTKIEIGKESSIMGELTVFTYGGNIKIGNNCFVGPDTRIWSGENISLGNNVLISHNVNIMDFAHEIAAADRAEGFRNFFNNSHPGEKGKIPTRPITIEDDVAIYAGCNIVMGVTIGKGSVISAGSVVIKDVPPFSLVIGNPAKVVWKTK